MPPQVFSLGFRKPWIVLGGSVFCMMALSYMRFAYTGVLTGQDVIEFRGWASWLAGSGFIVLLGIFGYGYYRVVMNDEGWGMNRREVTVLSLWLAVITTPMLPMLSTDIFGVFAYGDLALKGIRPYDSGYDLLQSDFFGYVAPLWQNAPCMYGPVSVAISTAAISIGGAHDLIVSIMSYKALNAVFVMIFILVISRLDGNEQSRFNAHALVLLSPLLWLQGSGQGHNDMIAAAFIAAALMSAMKRRYYWSAVLAALAFNAKISGAIVCPLLLLILWNSYKEKPWRFAANTLKCIGIFAAVTVIVWLPFYNGPQSIIEPWTFLNGAASNGGPIADVVRRVLLLGSILPEVFGSLKEPMIWADEKTLHASLDFITNGGLIATWAEKKALFAGFDLVMRGLMAALFLAIVVFNAWKYTRETSSFQNSMVLFAILGTAFLTLSSNVFHPWYMLIILPFYLYLDDRSWVLWVILVSIFINYLDIGILLHKSIVTSVLYITSLLTIVGLFLWRIRSRYFFQNKYVVE